MFALDGFDATDIRQSCELFLHVTLDARKQQDIGRQKALGQGSGRQDQTQHGAAHVLMVTQAGENSPTCAKCPSDLPDGIRAMSKSATQCQRIRRIRLFGTDIAESRSKCVSSSTIRGT